MDTRFERYPRDQSNNLETCSADFIDSYALTYKFLLVSQVLVNLRREEITRNSVVYRLEYDL